MALAPPSSHGGSQQPQEVTESATTDPNTFTVTETFDVGAPAVVVLKMTVTALDGDGETFGTGAGEIGVAVIYEQSWDGSYWASGTPMATQYDLSLTGTATAVGQFAYVLFSILKEGRGVATIVDDTGTPYAGPNNPTATLDFYYAVISLGGNLS